ncbi:MAG: hypothetical protein AB1896_11715 [Thermodesulfobacteriota bacterium]
MVVSPLKCLNEAVSHRYDLITVCQNEVSLDEQETLAELCTCLKTNPHSRETMLLALLPDWHRGFMERLHLAGVDWVVRYESWNPGWLKSISDIIPDLDPEHRTARLLEGLCPYLGYTPLDRNRELVTCLAHYGRLVLGRRIRERRCHTPSYKGCAYFLSPKPAPGRDGSRPGGARRSEAGRLHAYPPSSRPRPGAQEELAEGQ